MQRVREFYHTPVKVLDLAVRQNCVISYDQVSSTVRRLNLLKSTLSRLRAAPVHIPFSRLVIDEAALVPDAAISNV